METLSKVPVTDEIKAMLWQAVRELADATHADDDAHFCADEALYALWDLPWSVGDHHNYDYRSLADRSMEYAIDASPWYNFYEKFRLWFTYHMACADLLGDAYKMPIELRSNDVLSNGAYPRIYNRVKREDVEWLHALRADFCDRRNPAKAEEVRLRLTYHESCAEMLRYIAGRRYANTQIPEMSDDILREFEQFGLMDASNTKKMLGKKFKGSHYLDDDHKRMRWLRYPESSPEYIDNVMLKINEMEAERAAEAAKRARCAAEKAAQSISAILAEVDAVRKTDASAAAKAAADATPAAKALAEALANFEATPEAQAAAAAAVAAREADEISVELRALTMKKKIPDYITEYGESSDDDDCDSILVMCRNKILNKWRSGMRVINNYTPSEM
jgi:hypothetical protein